MENIEKILLTLPLTPLIVSGGVLIVREIIKTKYIMKQSYQNNIITGHITEYINSKGNIKSKYTIPK